MKRVMILLAALGMLAALGIREVLPSATQGDRGAPKTSLGEQIQALKARGEYHAELWSAFFANRVSTSRGRTSLDQGGDSIGSALVVPTLPYTDFGHTAGYTDDYYEACGKPDSGGSGDVVYSYYAWQHEVVDISLCTASNFDTKLYIYQNFYTPGNPYACNDDYCPGFLSQLNGIMFFPGNTYYIVVDGYGGEEGDYSIAIMPHQTEPCPCTLLEWEPNDTMPPTQMITLGQELCGAISDTDDVEMIALSLTSATAVRVTLEGNAGRLPCPGGLGLHPCAQILSQDGKVIANIVDTTNQATYWTSDFALGPFPYVVKIAGANNTVGPWILRVDSAVTPTVPPPEPRVTIRADSNHARLYWNASYVTGEQIIVEQSTDFQTWATYATVPAGVWYLDVPTSPPTPRVYFRLKADGMRPRDPFVGSILTLSEPGASPDSAFTAVGYYQVEAIEWGATLSNEVAIARLRAHGVGMSAGEWIDQDNRDLFNLGVLTPITDFTGRNLKIFGRNVFVQHIAFVKDPETQVVGIADGRGLNPSGDSTMFFNDHPVYLTPNVGFACNWRWFPWFQWCPDLCCNLWLWIYCWSSGLGWIPQCSGITCPGDPACVAGCPCQPVYPPAWCAPNCEACQYFFGPGTLLQKWCGCVAENPPPGSPDQPWVSSRCIFAPAVFCVMDSCDDRWVDIGVDSIWVDNYCPVRQCPRLDWLPVGTPEWAMRAWCEVKCRPRF